MRESIDQIRRSFGASAKAIASAPLRAAAALGLGATLGVVAMLTIAPFSVSANDDAGIMGVIAHDARQRAARSRAEPRQPSRLESFFQPLVRSFAPQPRHDAHRSLPAPIRYGYGPQNGDRIRPIDRTGAQQTNAPQRAASLRDAPRRSERTSFYQSRRTVCVSLCDGYHFPIGMLDSSSDLPAHEMACQAQCPAAPVKLFTLEAGVESIEQAVSRDLRTYASLAVAFNYRNAQSPSCSCQRQAGNPARPSLLHDFTLRRGDTVVTDASAQVFQGANAWPLRPRDFADFRASRQITVAERRKIDSIVGVSHNERLLKPFTIARVNRDAQTACIEIVRPQRRADVRRVDGPGARRLPDPAIYTAAAPAPASAGVTVIGAAPSGAGGPAIIMIERAVPARVASLESPSRAAAARPRALDAQARVIVTNPDTYRPTARVLANRSPAPGFIVVR